MCDLKVAPSSWLTTEARAQILYYPYGGFVPPTVPAVAVGGSGFGIAFGLGGGVGTFMGGWLGDRLGQRDPRWRQWVPAIGQFLSIPTALGAWLCADPLLSIVLLTFTYMFDLPGEKGGEFRDPPKSKELRDKLKAAKKEAEGCFPALTTGAKEEGKK